MYNRKEIRRLEELENSMYWDSVKINYQRKCSLDKKVRTKFKEDLVACRDYISKLADRYTKVMNNFAEKTIKERMLTQREVFAISANRNILEQVEWYLCIDTAPSADKYRYAWDYRQSKNRKIQHLGYSPEPSIFDVLHPDRRL